MSAIAHRVILAWGWERRLIAFLAGAVGALAMAPFDAFPALIVPMCVAVWLIDGSARRPSGGSARALLATLSSAAGAGWWLGFGYFVAGLWWLGAACLTEADRFAWALPFAVFGLPALLAFFTAFGFAVAALFWTTGAARVFVLAAALALAEYLRATLFTGFPWNEWGMALGSNLVLAQAGSIVGLHGLTVLAVAISALPAAAFGKDWRGRAFRAWPLVSSLAALAALAAFGAMRLSTGTTPAVEGVKLRIMQPDMPEDRSFNAANREAILTRYLTLSDRATSPRSTGLKDVTHLIWPESAFPFILSQDQASLERIGSALPAGTVLVTGAARLGIAEAGASGRPGMRYYNSIQVIGSGGRILDTYDKVHLVPFGEYVPFHGLLERLGVQHFADIPGGFTPGIERTPLHVPGLPPVAAVICYEAIFPGAVLPQTPDAPRPGLILNVTNDGWFGLTTGPYQHFAQARLRAIEEGLPLVRAANTGISAIVDPFGRVMASLPLGVADVLDGGLPSALPPTFFARHPYLPALALWGLSCLLGLALRRR